MKKHWVTIRYIKEYEMWIEAYDESDATEKVQDLEEHGQLKDLFAQEAEHIYCEYEAREDIGL